MKIWKIISNSNFDQLECENEEGQEIVDNACQGQSVIDKWDPLQMKLLNEGEPSDLLSEIPLVFTKKAIEVVLDLIKRKVEILPLVHERYECYAIHVLNVLDCIDYENADPDDFGGFDKFAFITEKIRGEHIFCALNTKHKYGDFPIVSVQTFVSNEFKERVAKSELKGFEFELVWESDEKNDEQKIENNPMIRPTSIEDFKSHIQLHYGLITNHIEANTKRITDVELYDVGPNKIVDYHTVVTYRNSYFRMPAPSSVDSGYAELVMHLPKDWDVSVTALASSKYSWPLRLLQEFGEMAREYGLGQWLIFPNQLDEGKGDYNASIHPYSKETEFSGVMIVPPIPQCSGAFKMEFREDGKRIEGDWPVYFHTLLPLYKEEIQCYFEAGLDTLLQKLLKNGVEAAFDFNRENTCK
ncbi:MULTISPECIES: suppressor of fused domain protein [unclassified Bacillus (in: firmicutes)]|uniref:suppressor of fused domain protein n=1 Tax=unclassified Bacillus (in: firmicutes) TaxID=185979 RepID=UPI00032DE4FB|nr:hypothetical protein ICS_02391 [Bacillus cereus BAG2O-3]EOQ10892.1 hypothetical protein KQ3_02496 [Bacillus cereus B5-2]PEW38787.1 hypothetical protein CN431_20305 [Bacillus cereus]PFW60217.1 hypothetical protein COL27_31695 [Bacillus sp. AFS075960]RFB46302.1 suppressor of fused domain protein [Bacillus sp. dmp10]